MGWTDITVPSDVIQKGNTYHLGNIVYFKSNHEETLRQIQKCGTFHKPTSLYSSKMSEKTLKKKGGGRGTALEKRMKQRRLNPIIKFAWVPNKNKTETYKDIEYFGSNWGVQIVY